MSKKIDLNTEFLIMIHDIFMDIFITMDIKFKESFKIPLFSLLYTKKARKKTTKIFINLFQEFRRHRAINRTLLKRYHDHHDQKHDQT